MALPGNKNFSDYDNYITDPNPTTSAQAQDYFRNQAELLKAVIDCDLWQPETVYQPGDVVKSDSMPNGTEAVMVATKASVTSDVEPQWGAVGGANISDGTCFWHLRYRAVSVNNIEADNKGNITIPVMRASTNIASGADGLVPAPPATSNELFLSNGGEWKEAGKVKSVNGKTGDVVVDLPVGHMYWSIEPNVPAGRLPALGATYNRSLYADLWAWANSVGLVKSESEWQAIASANDGNCAYYSSGDGSTTFRVPKLPTTIVTDASNGEIPVYGTGMSIGLTDGKHKGTMMMSDTHGFSESGRYGKPVGTEDEGSPFDGGVTIGVTTEASKSGIVAKTSATKITGQWLIVAFGVAHNIGNADVSNVMQAVEQVQTSLGGVEDKVNNIKPFTPNYSAGISVTEAQIEAGYTAPADGVLITAFGGDTIAYINNIVVSNDYMSGADGYANYGRTWILSKGDIYKKNIQSFRSCMFFPFK